MGGKGSTEAGSSRNIRHPPPYHDHSSYSQEPPYHTHSREWPPYRNYGYDSPPRAYPVARPYSPPRGYPPRSYPPQATTNPQPPQMQKASSHATSSHPKFDRRYSKIADHYSSLDQVNFFPNIVPSCSVWFVLAI